MVKDDKRGHRSWWWVLPAAAALALVAAAVLMALGGRTPSASAAACGLTITKTADASKAPIGGSAVYTLTVTNTGDAVCTNPVVVDDLVPHLDCTATTQPTGWTATAANGCTGAAGAPVTWGVVAGATLAVGATATFTLTASITSNAVEAEQITNQAVVGALDTVATLSNIVTVTVNDCDLTISKSDDPTKVAPDGQITYTIKVENVGTVDCTEDITVTDGIPSDTDCVSIDVTDDNGLDIDFDEDDCDASGKVVWDTNDTLDNGDEVELQMVVELNTAEDGDTIENEACVQATGFAKVCDTESTKVDEDVVTKTPTPGPTATAAPPTATPRPAALVVAPAPPAPSGGQAPSMVAPITGTGTAAGGSQPLALALALAGGCLLLLGGVAMLRRPR